jgi:hypothetical protein
MGYDWAEALRLIKAKRMGAAPHGDQVAALVEFAKNVKDKATTGSP